MVQQREPSLQLSAAMTRHLHRSSLPLWDVHLIMNSAGGRQQCQECTLESVTMHSKHLNSIAEDTARVEGTACQVWVGTHGKSSIRKKIGTAVKMETKNMHIESGQLQVYCSSLKDCKSIIRERGLSPFLRCPIIWWYYLPHPLYFKLLFTYRIYHKTDNSSNKLIIHLFLCFVSNV